MNINNSNDFWSEFRTFKKQIPSMDVNLVMDKVKEFKSLLTNFYTEPVINGKMEEIDKEVAKILNIKKNFITKHHEILGWEMPSDFIPYVEKGESNEMLPKRAYDAYMAMLTNSEFNMLCKTNYKYMEEYDRFVIDWLSKSYGIGREIVEYNVNKVIGKILRENGIEKQEFEELLEPKKEKKDNENFDIPENKVKEVKEWFSKRTLYGSWPVFTTFNPSIVELGVDTAALEKYYHKLTNNIYK